MDNVRLKTVSTVEAVCQTLENDVFSLYYAPGAKITESDLSIRYGVSRNTLREAIARLLSCGLLVKYPNRGVYVREITFEDVREIFHLREILESEAVRELADIGVLPPELYDYADELANSDFENDWMSYAYADSRFHELLVSAAGSPRLMRLYESIIVEVKLCIFQSRGVVPFCRSNAEQHRLLLDAIAQSDVAGALDILAKHNASAVRRYEDGFAKLHTNSGSSN